MQKINDETQEKIQQLQILEQNLQNFLMQKQAFQFEINEVENALAEIKKTSGDVYKLVGSIMIKAQKEDVEADLKKKFDVLSLRIKSIEKQESKFQEHVESIRKEVLEKIK
jgi:prefoldin beta subunit